ncbi:MAG: IS110 family transposase [Actinomycetota bacterium]
MKGDDVLGVGIDWAEDFHLVALGRPGDGVIARVEHRPKAIDALVAKIAEFEPDSAEVCVVIESRHGLLVERLIDAGYVVVPVNPDLVARRRDSAKKKERERLQLRLCRALVTGCGCRKLRSPVTRSSWISNGGRTGEMP